MRIAFISSLNGGVGKFTTELVNGLSASTVVDLYLFRSYNYIPDTFSSKVNVKIVKDGPLSLLFRLLSLLRQLGTYDLIHVNYAFLCIPAYIVKQIWGVPFVYVSHNFPDGSSSTFPSNLYYYLEGRLLRYASRHANAFITISHHAEYHLRRLYKTSNEVVIYHGIDLDSFGFRESKRVATRNSLLLGADNILIMYIGMLYEHKNVLALVRALPYVLQVNSNVKLLIIGRGVERVSIEREILSLGLSGSVVMNSYVEDSEAYFSAADIFVLPSKNEGFGYVLLEAMACGLPIIASNEGACPEVLGGAALYFSPDNHHELAEQIARLINDEHLFRHLKKTSLEQVKKYSIEAFVSTYFDVYNKALGRSVRDS